MIPGNNISRINYFLTTKNDSFKVDVLMKS